MFFDPLYMLIIGPTLLISIWAQINVSGAFSKYKKIRNASGKTGAEVAREILDSYGLHHIRIQKTSGFLSDHYDPGAKILRLSAEIYQNPSVAAAGVAAHEAGHAIQHAKNYGPLSLRSAIVPMAGIGSWIAFPLIIIGFLLHMTSLVWVGVVFFGIVVFFQLINLPVEFDASNRAKIILTKYGLISQQDYTGVKAVLDAAAMTYVAATVGSIAQLLYFVLIARR